MLAGILSLRRECEVLAFPTDVKVILLTVTSSTQIRKRKYKIVVLFVSYLKRGILRVQLV